METTLLDKSSGSKNSSPNNFSNYLSGISGMIAPVTTDIKGVYDEYNQKIQTPLEQNFNVANYNELANLGPTYMDMSGYKKMSGKDIFIDSQFVGAAEGAAAGMSLGPWGALAGAISGNAMHLWKDLAHNNVGYKDYLQQVNSFNTRQLQNYNNNILDSYDKLNYNYMKNQKVNYALGGEMLGQPTNQVTEFNTGGSHETNPYGGIPQGFGMNNMQNTVEEGEVKYNNFIFSKRVYPTKDILNKFNLPVSYFGLSIADIAKRLNKEGKERPSDTISNKGKDAMYERLQQAQEYQKVVNEAKKNGMTPEQYMQAMQQQPQEQQNSFAYGGPKDPPVVNYQVVDTDGASKPFTPQTPEDLGFIKERLYNGITPVAYEDAIGRTLDALINNNRRQIVPGEREDAYRLYMGLPQQMNTLIESTYKPTISNNENTIYYKLSNRESIAGQVLSYKGPSKEFSPYDMTLGGYSITDGHDKNGSYRSYYDRWDLNPFELKNPFTKKEITTDFGTPFEVYDRIYYKTDRLGNKIPVSNIQELLDLDVKNLSANDLDKLDKDLALYGFDDQIPGASGFSEEAIQKRLEMFKKLYKAVPGQTKELNPVQPQYNTTPNKYGKPKKNITKSNGTREYKGFNNVVNSFAYGGAMDGPGDPPFTQQDNTRVQQNNLPYNHPINQQQAIEAFIQEYIKQTAFLNTEQINQFNKTLNSAEQAVIQKLPQQSVTSARAAYVDNQTGTITPGKNYNVAQDWWRDFTQTQKGGEIVKFINNPIINQLVMPISGGATIGLMGAGLIDSYGQGADASEVGKEAALDVATMLIMGKILGGKTDYNRLGISQGRKSITVPGRQNYKYNMSSNRYFTPSNKSGSNFKPNSKQVSPFETTSNGGIIPNTQGQLIPTEPIPSIFTNYTPPKLKVQNTKEIIKPTKVPTVTGKVTNAEPNIVEPTITTTKRTPFVPTITTNPVNPVNKAIVRAATIGIPAFIGYGMQVDNKRIDKEQAYDMQMKYNNLKNIEQQIVAANTRGDVKGLEQAVATWQQTIDSYGFKDYSLQRGTPVYNVLQEQQLVNFAGKPIGLFNNKAETIPVTKTPTTTNQTPPTQTTQTQTSTNQPTTKPNTTTTNGRQSYSGNTSNYTPIDYDSEKGRSYTQKYDSIQDLDKLYQDWKTTYPNSEYTSNQFQILAYDNKWGPVHDFIYNYTLPTTNNSNTTKPTTSTTNTVDLSGMNAAPGWDDLPETVVTPTTEEAQTNNWNRWKEAAMFFNPARLAPIFNDLYNLSNQEGADPTLANSIRGAYTPIQAEQFGQQMAFTPFDWRANEIAQRAKAQSAQRTMMNIAGGNTAAATANLALQNAINQGDIAANYRQGIEYNNAQMATALGFNNQLDQANAMNRQQVNQANNANYMNSLINSAQVWDQEKKLIEQTRGQNQNMLAQNLGGLGQDYVNFNMINNNPALLYSMFGTYTGKK